MRFDTFNEVVTRYEQIKPVVSVCHTREQDIRPIGQRKRKCERIRKVDPETYCLLDGGYGNTLNQSRTLTPQFEQDMAPIMWVREADGDYIHIRNCAVGSMHMMRYAFLQSYLPLNVRFEYNKQGEHWVRARTPAGWKDFPLPKTRYLWDYKQWTKAATDDGRRLKFKANEDGTFTRAGESFTTDMPTVDKELKRQWKPKIDAFYIQAAALAPMLGVSWKDADTYRTSVLSWCEDNNVEPMRNAIMFHLSIELARQIMEREDHPLRIAMMALVIRDIGGKQIITSQNDLTKIKSAYNRLMNKLLGMFETKEI